MNPSYYIYHVIDSVPEFPYSLLSLIFVLTEDLDRSRHVLAVLFIYVLLGLFVGLLVKYVSHTKRPNARYSLPVICYDVPSLHTILSVGLVFFAFFIRPIYSLLLLPVALVYMQSRISLGFHTKTAVFVGAVIGVLVGTATGMMLWKISLSENSEVMLVVLVLIIPLMATYLRIVNYRRNHRRLK